MANEFVHILDLGYYQLFWVKETYSLFPNVDYINQLIVEKLPTRISQFKPESREIINNLPVYTSNEFTMFATVKWAENNKEYYFGCFVNNYFPKDFIFNNFLVYNNYKTKGIDIINILKENPYTFFNSYPNWSEEKYYDSFGFIPSLPLQYLQKGIIPVTSIPNCGYVELYCNRMLIGLDAKTTKTNNPIIRKLRDSWCPTEFYNWYILSNPEIYKHIVNLIRLDSKPNPDNYMYQYSREFIASVVSIAYPITTITGCDSKVYELVPHCIEITKLLGQKIYAEVKKNTLQIVLKYPLITDLITFITQHTRVGIESCVLYRYLSSLVDNFCSTTALSQNENEVFGLNEPLCTCTKYGIDKLKTIVNSDTLPLLDNSNETCFIGKCKGDVQDNIYIENVSSEVSFRNPFIQKTNCPNVCLQGITIKGDKSVASDIVQDCYSNSTTQPTQLTQLKQPTQPKIITLSILGFILLLIIVVVIVLVHKTVVQKINNNFEI